MTEQNPNALINPSEQAVIMEQDAREWHARIDGLMTQGADIIAFRGAGSVNGIDSVAASGAVELVKSYVSHLAESGKPVALMYDGDEDNRAKPDIGAIFGAVADAMKDKPNVSFMAAQSKGWYSPKTEGGALGSANGTPYETYVFPDDMPTAHDALTQSQALANYTGYEQIFVGPAGPIAFNQLKDVDTKAGSRADEAGRLKVTVIETPINHELGPILQGQLEAATDNEARAKIQTKIDQRQAHPYGALFTPQGELAVEPNQYPHLDIEAERV